MSDTDLFGTPTGFPVTNPEYQLGLMGFGPRMIRLRRIYLLYLWKSCTFVFDEYPNQYVEHKIEQDSEE